MTVDGGGGEHTAVLIQLLPQFARRYHQDRVKMDSAVNRMEELALCWPPTYGAKRGDGLSAPLTPGAGSWAATCWERAAPTSAP